MLIIAFDSHIVLTLVGASGGQMYDLCALQNQSLFGLKITSLSLTV